MTALSIRRYISPLIHILVWALLGFVLLVFHPMTSEITFPLQFWIKQGILFCLWLGAFYLNARVWVPKFLFQNRTGWFIIVNIATSIAVVLIIFVVEVWLELPQLMHQAFNSNTTPSSNSTLPPFKLLVGVFMTTLLLLIISTSIAVVQKWQKDTQIRQDLEKQQISSELSFLKAQINPHFFFNTLNNIYALTLIDVALARQALHTLSRMMRYVLYDTQKDITLLSKEIAFLQDYIELMKLRLTDKVNVTFKPPMPLKDVLIAPILFLPFVENAFKHGVSAQQPSCIHITISQQGPELQMEVRNTKFNEERMVLDESNGIGLVNTRRRLDLLYPNKYTLLINEHTAENEYKIHLTLDVS